MARMIRKKIRDGGIFEFRSVFWLINAKPSAIEASKAFWGADPEITIGSLCNRRILAVGEGFLHVPMADVIIFGLEHKTIRCEKRGKAKERHEFSEAIGG